MDTRPFNIVTKKDFLEHARALLDNCLITLGAKNDDYSTREQMDDGLKNFRYVESLGVVKAEHGVFVRLSDKITRIANFLTTGIFSVEDEKVEDTIQDAINYLVILHEVLKSYNPAKKTGLPSQLNMGWGTSGDVPKAEDEVK